MTTTTTTATATMSDFDAEEQRRWIEQSDPKKLLAIIGDNYSDEDVWKSVSKTGLVRELYAVAIQMAVVGAGNKSRNTFVLDSKSHNVQDVLRKAGVQTKPTMITTLDPGALTPRRIVRLFRFHISSYLEKNKEIEPYLWRKYTKKLPEARHTTFIGAEFLVTDRHQVDELLDAYKNLDAAMGTNISARIKRKLVARNVLAENDGDLATEPTQTERDEDEEQQI
ncbi:hypothetical protein GQ42DRAFT_159998 [Ramicandelaber brevisporus]|nr:hypothetical protein GQ42DRAFT_159998 [Ramicandelaber brevisporus]